MKTEKLQDPCQFVYEISDSGGLTMHWKLSSHLWAGYNMAHGLHCCLTFEMIRDWCSISSTIFRFHTKTKDKSMYFEQGIQLLHNHMVQTGNAATLDPPISVLVFYLIIWMRYIAFHTLLLSIGNILSAHCLKMLRTLVFFCCRPISRIVRYFSKSLK